MSMKDRKLPEGWKWVKLGKACDVIAGQSPPGETYRKSPDGLPFFQGKADFGLRHPIARTWCASPVKIAHPNDILISVRAPVGPTNVADVKSCIGRGLAAIRCGSLSDFDYILWTLKFYESHLARLGSGSTFPAINRSDLENLEIPLPPLPEQKRIAAILTEQMAAVEKARAAAEAQFVAAKALPGAYSRKVFPQPGQDLQEGWKWVKLIDLCTRSGQYGTSRKSNAQGAGLPVLGMYHIHEGQIRWAKVATIDLPENERKQYLLKAGDLLFNRTNSAELVGKTAVYDRVDDAVFASYLIRFHIDSSLADSHYVSAYINSSTARLFIEKNMARAIGQVNISASTMHGCPIPIPPLPEQKHIAGILNEQKTETEKLRKAIEDQLKEINALPSALLCKAFNGEL